MFCSLTTTTTTTTTDRAKAVLLSSHLLYVCLACILTSECKNDAVCMVVCVRVSFVWQVVYV